MTAHDHESPLWPPDLGYGRVFGWEAYEQELGLRDDSPSSSSSSGGGCAAAEDTQQLEQSILTALRRAPPGRFRAGGGDHLHAAGATLRRETGGRGQRGPWRAPGYCAARRRRGTDRILRIY